MDIKIPFLGDGIDMATVISVLVKEGDNIELDQTLCELETDKATAPVPATAAGKVLSIHLKENDQVKEGMLVLSLEADASSVQEKVQPVVEVPRVENTTSVVAPIPQMSYQATQNKNPLTSPSIRRIARQTGLDLGRIPGTGPSGRITIEDVQAYVAMLQAKAFSPSTIAELSSESKPIKPLPDFSKFGPIERNAVTSLRQKIADNLSDAWNRIPHVTQYHDADITALMALRKKHVPAFKKKKARLTVTVFILKALVETLKTHPNFNASYDEMAQEIILKSYYHIGVAVDTDKGLIVPVIRDVDKKSMLDLSLELADLSERARERKISLEDIQGASFTVSNLGGLGVGAFTPIINHPELAILGIGRAALKPVMIKDKIEYRHCMPLSLSYDHRVLDGADGARFIYDFAEALEGFDAKWVKE